MCIVMYSREKLVCIISAQFHFGVKNKNSSVVFRKKKKKEILGRQYSNSNLKKKVKQSPHVFTFD